MNLNKKRKTVLALVVLIELIIGFVFLFNFYQKKIVHKAQDPDKIAIIKKETLIFPEDNLIFPEKPELKYYYELRPNVEFIDQPSWLGYQVKYTSNADGLNERFDYEIEKPSDTFRVITLGDSFTYGIFVDTKDNWPEQLEDLLNNNLLNSYIKKFEVINLGMNGFDVPYIVKRYKDIGAKYNPDLIIWFESGSGFVRSNELMKEVIEACRENGEIIVPHDFPTKDHYCWAIAQKELEDKYPYEEFEKIITDYFDVFYSSINNERVLFFTFDANDLKTAWKSTLEEWKKKYTKIEFLPIIPSIGVLQQTLSDGHPSVQGHTTIATSIYEYLKK